MKRVTAIDLAIEYLVETLDEAGQPVPSNELLQGWVNKYGYGTDALYRAARKLKLNSVSMPGTTHTLWTFGD